MWFGMRVAMRAGVTALVGVFLSLSAAEASAEWRITNDHWSAVDEAGFGAFDQAFGESDCKTPEACFESDRNPYRDSDPKSMVLDGDCADFVYQLRGYYAWKNGLPFAHALAITPREGSVGDLRFNAKGNMIVARRNVLAWRPGFNPAEMLSTIGDHVSSATFRVSHEFDQGFNASDFYSPKIQRSSIKPGTVIYDINAHVAIVYRVDPDGTVHYVDSHPDRTLSRSTFGPHFPREEAQLGSGFKNFRPLKLVDYTKEADGSLSNGKFQYVPNDEIQDYSPEQYYGTEGGDPAAWKTAKFVVNGTDVGFYDYVRLMLAN
jgi:hypothetical protein